VLETSHLAGDFLYDGIVPVCEMNSSGTVTATNVFVGDGLVGRTGAANVYYVFDQQGNVAQRLNSSQSVTSSSTYDAYGVETSTGSPSDPFGYNAKWGYYFDREAGVYKCTFRDYDPSTGRWLTRDSISYNGGVNLYGYCGARPPHAFDLLGFFTLSIGGDDYEFTLESVGEGLKTSAGAFLSGVTFGHIDLGQSGAPGFAASEKCWCIAELAASGAAGLTGAAESPFVIGETSGRVAEAGEAMGGVVLKPSPIANGLFNAGTEAGTNMENYLWIKLNKFLGRRCLDIGKDISRSKSGKYYPKELDWLNGYPREQVPWRPWNGGNIGH
jgi:RHS repeat-associated protein